ncbi:MAG TPA: hypothetical protein VNC78_04810 [Actinomycetota bacterium]|nr:hypothetical protein [Actinomycetota bacterium]
MKEHPTQAQVVVTPSPGSTLRPPPADPLQTAGAVVGIALALAAAVLGYRILRGGRGL